MLTWLLWTVFLGMMLSGAHTVATCAPASWLLPHQVQQLPGDMLKQAESMQCSQVLWPQCFTFVAPDGPLVVPGQHDRQNLAMCKEVDSLLESLQNSWQALHQHSHACSVLGLSTDNGPCTQDTLTSIPMDNLADQHQQQQHGLTHMSNNWPPISCQQQDTHPDSAEQILVPTVSLGSHGDQNLPLQGKACEVSAEQQHTLFNTLVQAAEADSANQSWSAGSMLWGDRGLLLGLQRLWEHLMHDTQVVQQQLENEAQIGGQACRSCLVPHLHKSHREVVVEVVALLVLGALLMSGLLLAATFYRRRQSTRRHIQHNIAIQRQRHFEKLQLQLQQQQQQQQQQLQRQQEAMLHSDVQHPHLRPLMHSEQQHSPPVNVTVKHTRHRSKASEPAIPSSPSASSSHSEAIGTQVRSHAQSDTRSNPKRTRSHRSRSSLDQADTLHQGLGRSISDIRMQVADQEHVSKFEGLHQSVQSVEGAGSLAGSVQEVPFSGPSTPSSIAGSGVFNPFHSPLHSPPQHPDSSDASMRSCNASVDDSVDSKHVKQAVFKRKNRNSRKAAKKAATAKRRFIPGLDAEFDPAVHELPSPPQDSSSDPSRPTSAVEFLGSSASSPLPLPAVQCHRQLSVDAPVFVPSGSAQSGAIGANLMHYPNQQPVKWHHFIGQAHPSTPYQFVPSASSVLTSVDTAFSPRHSQASTSSSSSFSSYLNRTSPNGRPLYHDDRRISTPCGSMPKPSPRYSPTSVLPSHFTPADFTHPPLGSCHSPMSFGIATAQDRRAQLGFADSPRGWVLPPLMEEVVGSPFPGMPTGASQGPFHALLDAQSPSADILSAASSSSSAACNLREEAHLSIPSSLPGFSSIWSTATPSDATWQSFNASKQGSTW